MLKIIARFAFQPFQNYLLYLIASIFLSVSSACKLSSAEFNGRESGFSFGYTFVHV